MRIKCEFCNNFIEDTQKQCPNCGAVNKQYKRTSNGAPRTIAELQKWYQDRGLPPERVTRFFIGKDVREAKAFGIYQDGSRFIVYKNKSDGTRAIRYDGTDETYAVNELYTKLREEILHQKSHSYTTKSTKSSKVRDVRFDGLVPGLVICAIIFIISFASIKADTPKYYAYRGTTYVEYQNDWYEYDSITGDYDDVTLSRSDRKEIESYPTEWDSSITSFKSSDYYETYLSSDDSSSSDYDWSSSDSWDSSSSDWDSDW